ncbi:MAG: DUF3263 domain-containing protein [Actinomycetota bacterium]|nr:DUF3263 domain-containing protein [Actinomycetota bacterium]
MTTSGLDERARAVLDFERNWPAHRGAKDEAIRRAFGVTPARYYQLLARIVELPAAAAYDPLTVKRLRRRRDERRSKRTARALGERTGR